MKCAACRAAIGVLVGALAIGSLWAGGQADDSKVEEGYLSLFNGKDLTGWRQGKVDLVGKAMTPNKKWHVTDGAIVIDGGGGGDLYTLEDFNSDFHLKLEFRAAPKADSGLYIRGPQLQVRDYPRAGPYNKVKFHDGGWNELDITVKGGAVSTIVNGKTLTEKDVLELTVKNGKPEAKLNGQPIDVNAVAISVGAVALCKCNGEVIEKTFKAGAKGGIGLQSESGKFEFRRIRIKKLN
jgi:3-keto-disaccharide hydrolase